jgi:hypothetical protein
VTELDRVPPLSYQVSALLRRWTLQRLFKAKLGIKVKVMQATQYAPSPTQNTLGLLSVSPQGGFILSLPADLRDYQGELECLLGKVFSGRPTSAGNLALAKQMSINWCVSKCKQTGLSVDKCLELIQ